MEAKGAIDEYHSAAESSLPEHIIASRISRFVGDRKTFNALAMANKEIRRLMMQDSTLMPPWPKRMSATCDESETNTILQLFKVKNLAVSSSGRMIAANYESGVVVIWDAWRGHKKGRKLRSLGPALNGNFFVTFHPDDDSLLARFSTHYPAIISFWRLATTDTEQDTLLTSVHPNELMGQSIVIIPSACRLRCDEKGPYIGERSESTKESFSFLVRDIESVVLFTFRAHSSIEVTKVAIHSGANAGAYDIHFDKNTSDFIIAICDIGEVILFSGGHNKQIQKYRIASPHDLSGSITFSEDGHLLASLNSDFSGFTVWLLDDVGQGCNDISLEEGRRLYFGDKPTHLEPDFKYVFDGHKISQVLFGKSIYSSPSFSEHQIFIMDRFRSCLTEWLCKVDLKTRFCSLRFERTWKLPYATPEFVRCRSACIVTEPLYESAQIYFLDDSNDEKKQSNPYEDD